jgi:hypothetical protein
MLSFLPPRSVREVTLDGDAVPGIEAREVNHGTECNVFLDGRFGITIPAEHAQSVIWLLANALAIGAGYSCHGENSVYKPNPYKVKVMCIGSATDEAGTERTIGVVR